MEKLDKCYKIVLQSSAKGGIRAVEIAEKLSVHPEKIGVHKTTVHGYLNSLEFMGKIENQHGIWRAKTGEQTSTPLEKEIVIELPIPKNLFVDLGLLEILARDLEEHKFRKTAQIYRILLEKEKESRTIRITGKNVNDIDLEKMQNLVLQANKKSSKIDLKGFLKSLKRSRPNNPQGQ
jgi:hypothetical protein